MAKAQGTKMAKGYTKPGARIKGAANPELPRWGWFTAGFGFGLFVACVIYLWQKAPLDPASNPYKPTATLLEQDTSEQTAETEEEFKLWFYDLFTTQDVPIIEAYDQQESTASTPETRSYALQAGSFKLRTEADRLRGELILMGLEVRIQPVTAEDGSQWHRVILGPFDTKLTLNRAKTLLAQNDIQSMTLSIK